MDKILLPIIMIGLIPTIDIMGVVGNILNFLRTLREQLSEVADRVQTVLLFLFDKSYDFAKEIIKYFPYDNYQRTFILSILAVVVISSLLALFGVSKLTQPYFFSGYPGNKGIPNANAATNPSDLTVDIGRDTLRERIGVAGTGKIQATPDGQTTMTIPTGSDGDTGSTTESGIPDYSNPDIDGDGIPNNRDSDIDGDGIDNPNDPTPCGEHITCPAGTTEGTIYVTVCGNGVCDDYITDTSYINVDMGMDDNVLYYNIPYWCLKDGATLQWVTAGGTRYYGVVGSTYLTNDILNQYCRLSTFTHEVEYIEDAITCTQDCTQQNHTQLPYPEFCYNYQQDTDKGEEGIDCGGLCMPCHCTNGAIDENETGIDCNGGGCPPCSCTPTGYNTACSSLYCCTEGNGLCTNRCTTKFTLGIPTCCSIDIISGVYTCTEADCEVGCSVGLCTQPQPQIMNEDGSTVNGTGGVIWT